MINNVTRMPATPFRILIRGVNWLGDAVMTTPALQRLREALPESHVTLLTHEKLRDLWQGHPSLNRIVTFASRDGAWSVSRRLREEKFDAALVFPNSPRAALEVWLTRIPKRIGYARPWRNWFINQLVASRKEHVEMRKRSAAEVNGLINNREQATRNTQYPASAHQIHEYLHLTSSLGARSAPIAPYLHVAPEEMESVALRFDLRDDPAEGFFGLNPGAEYGPAKRWPIERFIAAAVEIQRRTRCRWLVFGGPADAGIAREIETGLRSSQMAGSNAGPLNLAGKTTLRELCVLLKLCRVVLTNDSGPMHVAAAVGTPVVVPFGSTSPELTGPGLAGEGGHEILSAHALCSPCFLRACPIDFRCMTGISVERVVEAVLRAAGSNAKSSKIQ